MSGENTLQLFYRIRAAGYNRGCKGKRETKDFEERFSKVHIVLGMWEGKSQEKALRLPIPTLDGRTPLQ